MLTARHTLLRMTAWTWVLPVVSTLLLGLAVAAGTVGPALAVVCGLGLGGAVVAAVHHAEVIAHRVGEPFGTLVLALAVTVIEASLILSMMVAGGADMAVLPRDTIYAAVMIIGNGVVGTCLVVGGLAHREQRFRVEGAGAGMAALVVMCALTLVIPTFTTSSPGGTYTIAQLCFVAVSSAALWAIFVFVQTIRHRDYFLPSTGADAAAAHAPPPTTAEAWTSFALLLVGLVAVVGLAKVLSPAIESAVRAAGAPQAVVGVAIALLVLLPESIAAIRCALADRLQTSMNLAFGSALATIGLTVPVVVGVCLLLHIPLVLGLSEKDIALLALTLLVCTIGIESGGRTSMMLGAVQLVIFAAFLFLAVVP